MFVPSSQVWNTYKNLNQARNIPLTDNFEIIVVFIELKAWGLMS